MLDSNSGQKKPEELPKEHRPQVWARARELGRQPWAEVALALVIGGLGGFLASRLRIPLAWILGPLVACFAGTLMGLRLRPIPYGRQVAHTVVGLAIGLRLTPAVLAATAGLLPAMGVATIYTIAVTTAAAFLLRRLAQVDRRTAFFGSAAAGMSEMAILATERGGDSQAVSIVHAVRVTCVVIVIPLLVFAFGADEGIQDAPVTRATGYMEVAIIIGLGLLAGWLATPFRIPSPWFLVPMMVGAIAAATWTVIEIPWLLLIPAQVILGVALGCRFERTILRRLPRVVAAAFVVAAVLILASVVGAAVLSATTHLSFATSFLAVAPAGITEMVLTARIMHLDTATVTAFQVMRILLINTSILIVYRLFERLSIRLDGKAT
jgi:membrane AbrB-like protein